MIGVVRLPELVFINEREIMTQMKINLSYNRVRQWPDLIISKITYVVERIVALSAIILIGYILLGLIMLYVPGLPVLWRPPKKNPDMLLFAAAASLYVLRRK